MSHTGTIRLLEYSTNSCIKVQAGIKTVSWCEQETVEYSYLQSEQISFLIG
jgi:hypothetical protein